jgi:hypothetical protein
MNDEFYIGYIPKAPAGLGRRISLAARGILLVGVVISAFLIAGQPPFAPSRFEYGIDREYTGTIEAWPYPMLVTGTTTFLLVAPGKHGLPVEGLQGMSVRLRGSLIERAPNRMLEVEPASIQAGTHPATVLPRGVDLGHVTLRGEIVDTKCYLGVMNPGERKVHRDCAVRCISGGVPPALVARDASGEARLVLLVGADGRRLNREVLPFVAEPIEVPGVLARKGTDLILKAEPRQFRRLSE